MLNELLMHALVADALRKAEQNRLINQAKKRRKGITNLPPKSDWVNFYLINFADNSKSKAVQGISHA
jgi:hypothetical protein